MGLYVMRTFWASRHMDSVECVTDQVRMSHSRGGDANVSGTFDVYCDGARKEIVVGTLAAADVSVDMIELYLSTQK